MKALRHCYTLITGRLSYLSRDRHEAIRGAIVRWETSGMKMTSAYPIAFLLADSLPQGALAHDVWVNGDPVPAWVKRQCCGPDDVHHLRDDQVHVTPDGYRLDGYRTPIPGSRLAPSPDGNWWVFYREYPDGTQSSVYCFFGPLPAS